jgi:hypothetical protein
MLSKYVTEECYGHCYFNRENGLTHCQFQDFLEDTEKQYGGDVYYSAVRWFSRGVVLMRFFAFTI